MTYLKVFSKSKYTLQRLQKVQDKGEICKNLMISMPF